MQRPVFVYVAQLVQQVRSVGAYNGSIVVLYEGDDALSAALKEPALVAENVSLVSAASLFLEDLRRPPPRVCDGGKRTERADMYYRKTAVFSDYFKRWDRVLWMDARNGVHWPLAPFFDTIDCTGVLMASPDAWPHLVDQWTLTMQFQPGCNLTLFDEIKAEYHPFDREYFQSTLMLFDTAIISAQTLREVAQLYYRISTIALGDQGVFAVYWHHSRGLYRQLPYRLPETLQIPFDFVPRLPDARYIVTAWSRGDD